MAHLSSPRMIYSYWWGVGLCNVVIVLIWIVPSGIGTKNDEFRHKFFLPLSVWRKPHLLRFLIVRFDTASVIKRHPELMWRCKSSMNTIPILIKI